MNVSRSIRSQRRAHPLGYVLLVAFLLFQVGYASHLDEHAIGDAPETCEICVQLDTQDHGLTTAPSAPLPSISANNADTHTEIVPGTQAIRRYGARAPPSD